MVFSRYMEAPILMTLFDFNYSLTPNVVTLQVRGSIHEFAGDTIQTTAESHSQEEK